jgi:hypothetical protein
MSAQVKKVAGGDFAGRFSAWWNGRDYVPPPAEGEAAEAAAAPAAKPVAVKDEKPEAKPELPSQPTANEVGVEDALFEKPADDMPAAMDPRFTTSGSTARLRALETIWGEGRFSPGTRELDLKLLEAAGGCTDAKGDFGFIGVDGAILRACSLRSEHTARVVEWRAACLDRLRELAPAAQILASEIDRPRGFEDGKLGGLISVEAFAYADHKAGLVGRAHRALSETGKWVFLDTTRRSKKTPAEAFASAWAEPQLCTADEIEELLKLAGFRSVKRENANLLLMDAAKAGYLRLTKALETAAQGGLQDGDGALYLQELAWEAQSWRARCRALEGGALSVDIWVASKQEEPEGDILFEDAPDVTDGFTASMDEAPRAADADDVLSLN